jgi:hypothetical protein
VTKSKKKGKKKVPQGELHTGFFATQNNAKVFVIF